jgi:hypothetical protein
MVVTGSVFPIGDGGVGKTSVAMALAAYSGEKDDLEFVYSLQKTVNMEFEFVRCNCPLSDEVIMAQMYVPPGQKVDDQGGEIGTFDKIVDTFKFMPNMQNISTVLLVYKLNDFKTFASLEAWLETALINDLLREFTGVILVGTHLDIGFLEVAPEQLNHALDFTRRMINDHLPTWRGHISHTVVSNINGRGIPELRTMIVESICIANTIRCTFRGELSATCKECMKEKVGTSEEAAPTPAEGSSTS